MKNLLGAIAILVVAMPWALKSIADGSININGLVLNLFETVQEIITREDVDWSNPAPPAAQPPQQPGNGGQL